MRKMKKVLSLALATSLCVSMAGCSSNCLLYTSDAADD